MRKSRGEVCRQGHEGFSLVEFIFAAGLIVAICIGVSEHLKSRQLSSMLVDATRHSETAASEMLNRIESRITARDRTVAFSSSSCEPIYNQTPISRNGLCVNVVARSLVLAMRSVNRPDRQYVSVIGNQCEPISAANPYFSELSEVNFRVAPVNRDGVSNCLKTVQCERGSLPVVRFETLGTSADSTLVGTFPLMVGQGRSALAKPIGQCIAIKRDGNVVNIRTETAVYDHKAPGRARVFVKERTISARELAVTDISR